MPSRTRQVFDLLILPGILCAAFGALYWRYQFKDLPIDGLGFLPVFLDRAFVDVGHYLYVAVNRTFLDLFGITDRFEAAVLCHRLNILYSVCSLLVCYLASLRLFRSGRIAFLGAVLMGVSPTYWWYSETIEVHALHSLAVGIGFYALVGLYTRPLDLTKPPWRQGRTVLLDFALLALGCTFIIGGHALGVLWALTGLLACAWSWYLDRSMFLGQERRGFRRGVISLFLLFGVGIGLAALYYWESVHIYWLNRTSFVGADLRDFGLGPEIRNVFEQLFSRSYLLSLYAIPGLIVLWFQPVGALVKTTATLGLLVHMVFMGTYVTNHGGFFIPIYLLNLSLSLYYLDRLCRFQKIGFSRVLSLLLSACCFLLYARVFYTESDLILIAAYLSLARSSPRSPIVK